MGRGDHKCLLGTIYVWTKFQLLEKCCAALWQCIQIHMTTYSIRSHYSLQGLVSIQCLDITPSMWPMGGCWLSNLAWRLFFKWIKWFSLWVETQQPNTRINKLSPRQYIFIKIMNYLPCHICWDISVKVQNGDWQQERRENMTLHINIAKSHWGERIQIFTHITAWAALLFIIRNSSVWRPASLQMQLCLLCELKNKREENEKH